MTLSVGKEIDSIVLSTKISRSKLQGLEESNKDVCVAYFKAWENCIKKSNSGLEVRAIAPLKGSLMPY
jgi:hypothetical protein